MPTFRFQATDDRGRIQAGEIVARDEQDALRQLTARGLAIEGLKLERIAVEDPPTLPATRRLTDADAEEVVTQIAEIGKARIPMAIGLRAAAAEATNRRVQGALEYFAVGADQGKSMEEMLHAPAGYFPAHVGGLIVAATRTAQLGSALEELLDHHRTMRDLRWTVMLALMYPLLVVGLAGGVFLFLMLEVVPVFSTMFKEFELQLPIATMSLIRVSDACVALTLGEQKWLALGVVVTTILTLLLIRLVVGEAGWRRFLSTAPLLGPIVAWSGAAAFAQMLGVLLDYEIPLPRALELTADAVRDGNVREACRRLSQGVADGQSLHQGLENGAQMPQTLAAFARSGEQQGDLASAMRLASEVFTERIGLRASMITSIAPPVIFVFVAVGIAASVIALFMPLVTLVVGLS